MVETISFSGAFFLLNVQELYCSNLCIYCPLVRKLFFASLWKLVGIQGVNGGAPPITDLAYRFALFLCPIHDLMPAFGLASDRILVGYCILTYNDALQKVPRQLGT